MKIRVNTASEVTLSITRGQGIVVRSLVSRRFEPGEYEFLWDGLDDDGNSVPAGRNFLTLLADSVIESVPVIEH